MFLFLLCDELSSISPLEGNQMCWHHFTARVNTCTELYKFCTWWKKGMILKSITCLYFGYDDVWCVFIRFFRFRSLFLQFQILFFHFQIFFDLFEQFIFFLLSRYKLLAEHWMLICDFLLQCWLETPFHAIMAWGNEGLCKRTRRQTSWTWPPVEVPHDWPVMSSRR